MDATVMSVRGDGLFDNDATIHSATGTCLPLLAQLAPTLSSLFQIIALIPSHCQRYYHTWLHLVQSLLNTRRAPLPTTNRYDEIRGIVFVAVVLVEMRVAGYHVP